MAANINRVTVTGNLTKDPELKTLDSGFSICNLRIACNSRKKEGDNWVDKPNYFNVTVYGKAGENAAKYLAKGRAIAVDGRLEWREWETDGQKRQAVDIVAENVQFLGGGNGDGAGAPGAADAAASSSDDEELPF
jgi:single-strand DNA-binding protein